jgi:hypothetical protein
MSEPPDSKKSADNLEPRRASVLDNLEVDLVEIVIGVLLAKLVSIWADVYKCYVQSRQYPVKTHKYETRLRAALISTCLIGVVIIIIYSALGRALIHEKVRLLRLARVKSQ